MNREQIEKAANNFLLNEPLDLPETAIGAFKEGFINGTEWRINSVWHDASEKYEIRLPSVVVFKNGKVAIYLDLRYVTYDSLWDEVKDYAYLRDLRPERKEESK